MMRATPIPLWPPDFRLNESPSSASGMAFPSYPSMDSARREMRDARRAAFPCDVSKR